MFIPWNDSYALGIPSLDADHRLLVDVANHFFARSEEGAETKELVWLLNQVVETALAHFKREETLLDRNHYHDLASHAARHDRTLLQLKRFIEPYKDPNAVRDLTRDRAETLSRLLVDHILEEDLPCRPYLKRLA